MRLLLYLCRRMSTLRYILAVVAWLAVSLAASGQEMPADTVAWPDSTVHLNKFQQFKYIILPSIKTIFVLNVILSISGSLSAFEPPYVITDGANGTGTYFVVMHDIAHTQQKVGLASAMAVVLLGIIFLVTIFQKLFFKYVFKDSTQ